MNTGTVLAGTNGGLVALGDGRKVGNVRKVLEGHRVDDVARGPEGWLALVDGDSLWRGDGAGGDWKPFASIGGPRATCLLAADGAVIVGTEEAHLVRVDGTTAERLRAFDEADGRDRWYAPWGGPPDARSLAVGPDGALYANVHVGGIVRSTDAGATWAPTIDVDADVHQVCVAAAGDVLAATAYGLARSRDGGATWTFVTEGLHDDYSRALAVAGAWLLLSASTGPRTRQAAVYRRPLAAADDVPFERCRDGLPDWFEGNVDTRCLAASGERAALGTADGAVYVSDDAGASWTQATSGLDPIACLVVTS